MICIVVGLLPGDARAQSVPCHQCPTLLQLCGPKPPDVTVRPIPPEPPKRIVTTWTGRTVRATGGNDLPLETAKGSARSAVDLEAILVCRQGNGQVVDGHVVHTSYSGESCTPNSDGTLYTCTVQATPDCRKEDANPDLQAWRDEKKRMEELRVTDEQPGYDYAMCERANRSTVNQCQSTCGQSQPGGGTSQDTGGAGNTGTGGSVGGTTGGASSGATEGDSGDSPSSDPDPYTQAQQNNEALHAQQNQALESGMNSIGGMVAGMDEESKTALENVFFGAIAVALVGAEVYGLYIGHDVAEVIAGGLVLAGATGLTIWRSAAALSTHDPAEGPYSWGEMGYRVALGYERGLVNYTGKEMDRSFVHGIRGSISLRMPWVLFDVEGGVRFGTVKSDGLDYSHWGIPLVATFRIQPLSWGHLFSPFAGAGYTVYVQSNSAEADNNQEFRGPATDTSDHWVIGNTFSLGRWLGSREIGASGVADVDAQSTLFVEPSLSIGGMGTSFIVRVGALSNIYVDGDPNKVHEELQPGEVNSKATLAGALVLDEIGTGAGLQFGSCVRFKVQEGGNYCVPMFTGLYFNHDGNAYADAHVLGIGYGLFYENWQAAGFATAGMRIHGSEPPGETWDYFDPSVAIGAQVTVSYLGASVQILPLPDLTTVLSAGVAF